MPWCPELRGQWKQPGLAHSLDKLPQTVLWSQDIGRGKKSPSLVLELWANECEFPKTPAGLSCGGSAVIWAQICLHQSLRGHSEPLASGCFHMTQIPRGSCLPTMTFSRVTLGTGPERPAKPIFSDVTGNFKFPRKEIKEICDWGSRMVTVSLSLHF